MACAGEGNHRFGVTLATCHRHQWFSTYGLKAWEREMSTPYALLWSMVDFTFLPLLFIQILYHLPPAVLWTFATEDKINDEDDDNENHY